MTFSLMLSGGDLVQQGSALAIVSGTAKLRQDMGLWLTERLGVDRFHPTYGSILPNFIGGMVTVNTQAGIGDEVDRVLGNYQAVQRQAFEATPQLFSFNELLNELVGVDVGLNYDTCSVAVAVTTGSQSVVTVNTTSSV